MCDSQGHWRSLPVTRKATVTGSDRRCDEIAQAAVRFPQLHENFGAYALLRAYAPASSWLARAERGRHPLDGEPRSVARVFQALES